MQVEGTPYFLQEIYGIEHAMDPQEAQDDLYVSLDAHSVGKRVEFLRRNHPAHHCMTRCFRARNDAAGLKTRANAWCAFRT